MASFSFSPGHDVVGRYRITETLGVGSTAEVYVAEDRSLQRTVVVKFLLPNLAAHEDVRRAFREQIIRAATLSHPHLARVFDGGQESGSIFMVTEYLSGGSLEDVLSAGRRLNVDDTAKLGRDVAGALAYLHANDITLGTLSPSKILIDDEGGVRVSDVALTGLRAMHPGHHSLNDVRYLSPEQAQGELVSPTSDVYALALILFEAATGDSPFEAVSAEAMLRARINSPLPIRPELGTLDMILAQAAVPDPSLRLSAEQFAHRLGGAVTDSAPLRIAPVRAAPLLAHYQPAEPRTSIGFRPPSADQIVGSTRENPVAAPFPHAPPPRRGAHAAPASDERALRRAAEPYPVVPPPRRRRPAFVLGAIVLALVVLGGAAIWKFGLTSSRLTVPSLVGLTTAQANAQLSGDRLTVHVARREHSSSVPANEIVSQTPVAGSSTSSGSVVAVTLSEGPLMVTVPSVLGQDCAAATALLRESKVGAQCPSSAAVASTVPVGEVVEVLYHGHVDPATVPVGSTVVLALSRGPIPGGASATTTTTAGPTTTSTTAASVAGTAPRAVPNVIGMGQAQTIAAFRKAVLFFRTKGPGSANRTWTTVVSTVPSPGTLVPYRSTIIVNVK